METTIYIIADADAYRFGHRPTVRLTEPESISRMWITRAVVELPQGFEVAESVSGTPLIYRGNEHYELITNAAGEPVIVDHHNRGAYIPLTIISEGWEI